MSNKEKATHALKEEVGSAIVTKIKNLLGRRESLLNEVKGIDTEVDELDKASSETHILEVCHMRGDMQVVKKK